MKIFRPVIILFFLTAIISACTQQKQIPSPNLEDKSCIDQPVPPENSFSFSYRNISLVTPPFYSNKIIAEELELAESSAPDKFAPTYIGIQFRDKWDLAYQDNIPSMVLVYPVADLSQTYEQAAKTVSALSSLLLKDPVAPLPTELPFWPLVYYTQVAGASLDSFGTPVLTAHAKQLNFRNGNGVRYLTFLENLPPRIHRMDSLIYTYQGLTKDKQFYVSVIIPVHITDQKIADELESLASQTQPNYPIIQERLNAMADEQFYLSLGECDQLISSLEITP